MASKLSKRKKARHLVVQSLYEWQMSDNEVPQIVAYKLENKTVVLDDEYYREVMYAIGETAEDIDAEIQPFLSRALSEVDPIELAVLRMACYELQQRIDIPYKVVINEALELAKRFGATDSHKFVNGVLDKLAKKLRPEEQRLAK